MILYKPNKLLSETDKEANRRIEPVVQQLLQYVNNTPALLSLLYDLDLMPEQLERGSRDWVRMLMIAKAWKDRFLSG